MTFDGDAADSPTDVARRFGALSRLYGPDGPTRLQAARIAVVGLGGVGSWAAEALARCGVGQLTLIDLDHIAESNINRQLHAVTHTLGQAKVEAMAERVWAINPNCAIELIDDFVTPDNAAALLAEELDVIVDCTDQAAAKIAMIMLARDRGQNLVVCGGAGGKTDPLALRAGDLSLATHDALLAKLRNVLRKQHGFAKPAVKSGHKTRRIPKMGVRALWFEQQAILPSLWQSRDAAREVSDAPALAPQGLSCAGYGSVVMVTAAMGMAAANEVLQQVLV